MDQAIKNSILLERKVSDLQDISLLPVKVIKDKKDGVVRIKVPTVCRSVCLHLKADNIKTIALKKRKNYDMQVTSNALETIIFSQRKFT